MQAHGFLLPDFALPYLCLGITVIALFFGRPADRPISWVAVEVFRRLVKGLGPRRHGRQFPAQSIVPGDILKAELPGTGGDFRGRPLTAPGREK